MGAGIQQISAEACLMKTNMWSKYGEVRMYSRYVARFMMMRRRRDNLVDVINVTVPLDFCYSNMHKRLNGETILL